MDDMADDLLAAGVLGMGFAGKDELDRTLRIVQQPGQTLGVSQEQIAAFVGGEAPGENRSSGFGVKHFLGCRSSHDTGRDAASAPSAACGEHDQPFLAALMGAPQFLVGNLIGLVPYRLVEHALGPGRPQIPWYRPPISSDSHVLRWIRW